MSAGLAEKVLLLTPNGGGVTAPKRRLPSLSLRQEMDALTLDWPGNIVEVGQNLGLVASEFNPLDVTATQVSECMLAGLSSTHGRSSEWRGRGSCSRN